MSKKYNFKELLTLSAKSSFNKQNYYVWENNFTLKLK